MRLQWIKQDQEAPEKPPYGEPCTGCGVCCLAEPCPLGRLRFWQWQGACPAVQWENGRYVCGLVVMPKAYFGNLPPCVLKRLSIWVARAISAGRGCDSTAIVDD